MKTQPQRVEYKFPPTEENFKVLREGIQNGGFLISPFSDCVDGRECLMVYKREGYSQNSKLGTVTKQYGFRGDIEIDLTKGKQARELESLLNSLELGEGER
jgi:hypothetical protein